MSLPCTTTSDCSRRSGLPRSSQGQAAASFNPQAPSASDSGAHPYFSPGRPIHHERQSARISHRGMLACLSLFSPHGLPQMQSPLLFGGEPTLKGKIRRNAGTLRGSPGSPSGVSGGRGFPRAATDNCALLLLSHWLKPVGSPRPPRNLLAFQADWREHSHKL